MSQAVTPSSRPPSESPDWRHTRARLANFARNHPGALPPVELRADHVEATLAAHIRKVVAEAPPLSAEQRDRLAVLLRPADSRAGGAA